MQRDCFRVTTSSTAMHSSRSEGERAVAAAKYHHHWCGNLSSSQTRPRRPSSSRARDHSSILLIVPVYCPFFLPRPRSAFSSRLHLLASPACVLIPLLPHCAPSSPWLTLFTPPFLRNRQTTRSTHARFIFHRTLHQPCQFRAHDCHQSVSLAPYMMLLLCRVETARDVYNSKIRDSQVLR